MTALSKSSAPAPELIALPAARTSGGKPLLDALRARQSLREFSEQDMSLQDLSDLLWAAHGINRADGHRTAPSARNWQEIDVYVALKYGLFLHDPHAHSLKKILDQDIREATGMQDFVGTAPLNLIYVADLARMDAKDRTEQRFYSAIDAGFIAQNVYLYCASEGLATVVRGLVPRKELAQLMRLRPVQRVIVAQTVGYP
jgi:SagB-type dehydrogenase family enzyme